MLEFTAAEIAKLAFSGAIQAGAGALTVVGIEKAKQLWQTIRDKFQGNPMAIEVLNDVEEQRSQEILEAEIVPLLQMAMRRDEQFAEEIQVLAKQIDREININTGSQKNITIGDVRASEEATAIGNLEVEGNIGSIGGTHEKKTVAGDEINQSGSLGIGVNKGTVEGNVIGEDRSKK